VVSDMPRLGDTSPTGSVPQLGLCQAFAVKKPKRGTSWSPFFYNPKTATGLGQNISATSAGSAGSLTSTTARPSPPSAT